MFSIAVGYDVARCGISDFILLQQSYHKILSAQQKQFGFEEKELFSLDGIYINMVESSLKWMQNS